MFEPRKQLSLYVLLTGLVRMSICIPGSESLFPIYEPWLRDVSTPGFNPKPSIGGANHTKCCMQAVNEALMMDNGTIRMRPDQTFLHGNLSMLEQFPQFPCVAKLNNSASLKGPGQFLWTPYDWCTEKCPGWAGIPFHAYDSWVKPLISFILPSLVFALNVPRRRKVSLAKRFFPIDALSFGRLFFFALKVPLTMLIITLDLLVWLSVLFAIAGPVLMSGMYEAYLDAQILDYLSKRMQSNNLSIQQRAHLLLVILIGNLDYTPAWDHSVQFVRVLPTDAPRRRFSQYRDRHTSRTSAAGSHLAPDDTSLSPLTRSSNDNTLVTPMVAMTTDPNSLYNEEERARIQTVQVKLSAMLDSQVKFGSTVGAPILFYIGSFIYSVFDVESNIGEHITAHQLAFGMFWMTIPHIAIVCSLLLAGNNPSIWQAASLDPINSVFRLDIDEDDDNTPQEADKNGILHRLNKTTMSLLEPLSGHLQKSYNPSLGGSLYKPAWIWNRGPDKAQWIQRLSENYNLQALETEVLQGRFGNYLWVCTASSVVLVFLPAFLGGLVSYNTPQTGLACRSLLMLTYGISQLLLISLVLLDWCFWKRDNNGKVTPFGTPIKDTKLHITAKICRDFWFLLGAGFGFFTSIIGTVFILIGLFNNCVCAMPARYWLDRTNPKAQIFWNTGTREQIWYAERYWFPSGVAGAVFLVIAALVGWWYQRSLLARFHDMVSQIGHVKAEDLQEAGN